MSIDPAIITLVSFCSLVLGIASTVYGFAKASKTSRKSEIEEAQKNAVVLNFIQTSVTRIEQEQYAQRSKDEEIQSELRRLSDRVLRVENTQESQKTSLDRVHDRLDKITGYRDSNI